MINNGVNNYSSNITNTTQNVPQQGDLSRATLYFFIVLLVSFINIMVIVSYFLRKKNKRSIPDVFMLSLAVSSILTMVTVVAILAYVRATGNEYFEGLMGACYVQVYFGTMLRVADVSITTAITIDRFFALYKPLVYRLELKLIHGKVACIVLWLLSGFIAVLPFIGFGNISMQMESFCTADWSSEISYVVLCFAYVQFVVVLLCYIGIFRTISGLVNRQKAMSRSQTLSYSTTKRPLKRDDTLDVDDNDEVFRSSDAAYLEKKRERLKRQMSYSNGSFSDVDEESQLSGTSCQITEVNVKSALETVQEVDEYQVKTKVKIKSIERKVNMASFYSSTSKTSVSVQVDSNNVSWSDLPQDETTAEMCNNNNLKSTGFTINSMDECSPSNSTASHSDVLHLTRANSLPVIASSPHQEKRMSKSYSCDDHNQESINANNSRLRSISIVVKEKFQGSRRKKCSTSTMKNFWAENQRFAKVMGVVVLLFYISWLPIAISINVVLVTGNERNNYYDALWTSYNLSLIGSVAIPIAYAVMCKPYREPYKLLWGRIKESLRLKRKKRIKITVVGT